MPIKAKETQRIPIRQKQEKNSLYRTIIKTLNGQNKEKILKPKREKTKPF